MSDATLHPARAFRAATQEAPLLRAALIGIAVAGLAVLVFAPLAIVFAEALKDGWLAAVESLGNRDARSAIQLTLLITAIAVPLNAAFGIADHQVRLSRQGLPDHADRPALLGQPGGRGLVHRAAVRRQFGRGRLADRPWLAHRLCHSRHRPGDRLRDLSLCRARTDPRDDRARPGRGRSRPDAWALLYGTLLCTARAMGEFGAVAVVSGKIRGQTATMPITIEMLYNEYLSVAAFSMAALLTALALVTLLLKTLLELRHADQLAAIRRH